MTENTPLNGQIPPRTLLLLALAVIGRLDPETATALGTALELAFIAGLTQGPRTGP
ncbi:hypothetical protein [Streptomyces sp. NPDC060366]|uniref:hypothetical protein n=1 Tax=Streptomyces sp. NPDC060366 TaxID=3347105 RepID=UPI00365E0A12